MGKNIEQAVNAIADTFEYYAFNYRKMQVLPIDKLLELNEDKITLDERMLEK